MTGQRTCCRAKSLIIVDGWLIVPVAQKGKKPDLSRKFHSHVIQHKECVNKESFQFRFFSLG